VEPGHYRDSVSDGEGLLYADTAGVVAVAPPGQPSVAGGGAAGRHAIRPGWGDRARTPFGAQVARSKGVGTGTPRAGRGGNPATTGTVSQMGNVLLTRHRLGSGGTRWVWSARPAQRCFPLVVAFPRHWAARAALRRGAREDSLRPHNHAGPGGKDDLQAEWTVARELGVVAVTSAGVGRNQLPV